jgi:uncharacterized protein (TIGR03437 family)
MVTELVTIGGGNKVVVFGANIGATTPETVWLSIYTQSPEGQPELLALVPPYSSMMLGTGPNVKIADGKSVSVSLLMPAGCDTHWQGCQGVPAPDSDPARSLTVLVAFQTDGDSPKALEGLAPPTVAVVPVAVPPPVIYPAGVVNGAGFVKGPIAPGGIIAIFGDNFTDGCVETSPRIPLSRALCGTTLLVDGNECPLFYVGKGQINAQVPFELGVPATVRLQVVRNGIAGNGNVVTTVELTSTAPSVFTWGGAFGGVQTAIVTDAKGGITTLRAGKVVVFWAAGLGYTAQGPKTGEASPCCDARVFETITVTVDGVEFPVEWAGLTPGLVGLYQVNVRVPEGFQPKQVVVTGVIKTKDGQNGFYALADTPQ